MALVSGLAPPDTSGQASDGMYYREIRILRWDRSPLSCAYQRQNATALSLGRPAGSYARRTPLEIDAGAQNDGTYPNTYQVLTHRIMAASPRYWLNLHNLQQAGRVTLAKKAERTGGPDHAPIWTCTILITSINDSNLTWNEDYVAWEGSCLEFIATAGGKQDATDMAAHNTLRAIGFDFAGLQP
ncbi:hypothetical protein FRB99_007400 [Tulasnella sp. 403]|nr:hypothetical protein FRB99_007400 [Tulasnella sp. 403]